MLGYSYRLGVVKYVAIGLFVNPLICYDSMPCVKSESKIVCAVPLKTKTINLYVMI